MLKDLKIQCEDDTKLFCDYKSAINIAHNLIQDAKTKNIEHFTNKRYYTPTKGET